MRVVWTGNCSTELLLFQTKGGKAWAHVQRPPLSSWSCRGAQRPPELPGEEGKPPSHRAHSKGDRDLLQAPAYQVVVRPDPKELPEVAEGHRRVGLEAEVVVVMSWGQVTPFTEKREVFEKLLKKPFWNQHPLKANSPPGGGREHPPGGTCVGTQPASLTQAVVGREEPGLCSCTQSWAKQSSGTCALSRAPPPCAGGGSSDTGSVGTSAASRCQREEREHPPGEENTFYYVEILHENISFGFGAQAADRVGNAQLNGTFQGGGGRLKGRASKSASGAADQKELKRTESPI